MRKKYLSALLFGALLFASAGTFTSCKDYDDDIKNLQGQIDANADAIKALQDLVNNGDYVTAVKKSDDGKGIVFTFSKSGDQTVTLDIENGQEGDVLSIDPTTGELLKNGEPTGIKPAKDETLAPVKAEGGVWVFLNDKGEYESTNIPVSGVTAVQNENKQWVLTITDANGAQSTVVVPSAASVMSDLVLAGWIDGDAIGSDGKLSTGAINTTFGGTTDNKEFLPIEYCYITAITKAYDKDKETTWSAQKDVVKGQVLTSLRGLGVQLVTRVAPADLDLSSMKFTLQDSEGNTLPITLNPSENFDGTLTRAANSSINLIPLDVTTNTYANANAYAALYGANDGKTLYSLVEESGARSNYGLAVKADVPEEVKQQKVVEVDGKVSKSETIDGKSVNVFEVDLNKANKLTFGTKPEYVYDYYVEPVDKAVADLFGVQIDKKAGTFTVTKLSDQITRATFELYVYALHIDGKIYRETITIKPSNKIVAAATLAAGEQIIKQSVQSDGKTVDKDNHMRFDISLDAMFNAMSDADKAKWTSATLGANADLDITKVIIGGSETAGQEETAATDNYYDIELLDADGEPIDDVKNYYKAKTMRVYAKYRSELDEKKPLLEVDKEYELTINFYHDKEVLNTVKMTYTPVLPALSDYMQKHPSFWNDDQTVLLGVDNSINETFIAGETTPLNLNYAIKDGFKKLGSDKVADEMDITFELADYKVNNKEFVEFESGATTQTVKYTADADENKNYGKEFTVKVEDVTYLTAYKYSAEELAAQTFKMQVLSPIVEGEVKVKEGTAVEVYASRNAKLNIADLVGYNYNKQTYNLYMDVVVDGTDKTKAYEVSADKGRTEADNYADKSIASVKFESGDTQVFRITEDMSPVDDSAGTPAIWNATTKSVDAGYVTLDTSNVSQDTETTIKVTVTDIWGYEKTVEVPLLIKMAE